MRNKALYTSYFALSGYDGIFNTTRLYYETAISTFHVAAALYSRGGQYAGPNSGRDSYQFE